MNLIAGLGKVQQKQSKLSFHTILVNASEPCHTARSETIHCVVGPKSEVLILIFHNKINDRTRNSKSCIVRVLAGDPVGEWVDEHVTNTLPFGQLNDEIQVT